MNWDNPTERARLIEQVGPVEYQRRQKEHREQSAIEVIGGHALRQVASRFGSLIMVGDTGRAFRTLAEARNHATKHPRIDNANQS